MSFYEILEVVKVMGASPGIMYLQQMLHVSLGDVPLMPPQAFLNLESGEDAGGY